VSEERPIQADAITKEFVPVARPDLVQVEVDGEIVLYDDETKVMHRLSPTAGQVWRCLDGSGNLAEIAADIADVYRADPGQVLADLITTARQFGSAGLLVGVADLPDQDVVEPAFPSQRPEWEDPEGPFLADPFASAMDPSFPLGEAGSLTVKVGPHLLGVRFSTPELVEMAREVFAPSVVEGVAAPPNVSVKVTKARAGTPLLYCYFSNVLVTRARSAHRAFEAAASLLSSYAPPANVGVRVAALSAIRSGAMALFAPESRAMADRLVPRLRRAGWEVLDAPFVELDTEGGAVIAPLAVAMDATALARVPARQGDGIRPTSGRYPVAAWIAVSGSEPIPQSMAGRVALVTAGVPSLDAESAPAVVEIAAAMLRRAAWAVSPSIGPNDLLATLARVVP
jgi:Coenzyme PQQ synthesis protein D (PqqD)